MLPGVVLELDFTVECHVLHPHFSRIFGFVLVPPHAGPVFLVELSLDFHVKHQHLPSG